MALPVPPSPPPQIDWGTLLAGFSLGFIGSTGGAFIQAFASSFWARRDHQFQRVLSISDEIRHDIERVVSLSYDYWGKDGGHADCIALESQILEFQTKIVGALALVRAIDGKRFKVLEEDLQNDFFDALTGGQFQVRGRVCDIANGERVRRFGGRLAEKIAKCSASPKAGRLMVRAP